MQKKNEPGNVSKDQDQVIPVIQEELQVTKHVGRKGITRVKKEVHQREKIFDEPLLVEEVTIERKQVNRFVEEASPVRHEDDTTIIPIFQEVLTKRLLLKEEIHVRKVATKVSKPQKVSLLNEEAIIERVGGNEDEKKEDK